MSERRRYPPDASEARGTGGGGRRGAWQSRASAHTPSIADGTALHRGRVGSRHFEESPLGLSFFASTLLYHVATQVCVHRAGEAVKAHRECPVDIRWSKCAARVRSSLHRCKDIELLITKERGLCPLRRSGHGLSPVSSGERSG